MPSLAHIVELLDARYDPAAAESWDAVGLVCGDPSADVSKILFAVDPVAVVADEAVAWGADLVVVHHPLFLRGVHGVAATTPKGRVVHRLISHGIGLHVAHTNADSADPGVSDALGDALGLASMRPLAPQPRPPTDKLVVFVPEPDTERVLDALAAAGAGHIGAYERCAWTATGIGTFRPGAGANPTIGQVGAIETVTETRVEMVMPRSARAAVVSALFASHPYEEPAYDVYELAGLPGGTGIGRVGTLPGPEPLPEFARRVARTLPATAAGIRVSGDPDQVVETVAVCGGAGGTLLDAVRASDADAYVTADLRHHPASEAGEAGPPALVDVSHWASEWPWLPVVSRQLVHDLQAAGITVDTRVSTTPTDPWTMHVGSEEGSSAES